MCVVHQIGSVMLYWHCIVHNALFTHSNLRPSLSSFNVLLLLTPDAMFTVIKGF